MHYKKLQRKNCKFPLESIIVPVAVAVAGNTLMHSATLFSLVRTDFKLCRWNRNWRYHKDLRIWITKESGSAPSSKIPGGEAGTYTWWNPDDWCKERKEMNVRYADLEEKTVPAFVMGPGLVLAQPGQNIPGQQQVLGATGQQGGAQSTGQSRMQMAGI